MTHVYTCAEHDTSDLSISVRLTKNVFDSKFLVGKQMQTTSLEEGGKSFEPDFVER